MKKSRCLECNNISVTLYCDKCAPSARPEMSPIDKYKEYDVSRKIQRVVRDHYRKEHSQYRD